MSSAFALAAVAAVSGQANFLAFPERSLPPGRTVCVHTGRPGSSCALQPREFRVSKAARLNGIAVNLKNSRFSGTCGFVRASPWRERSLWSPAPSE